MTLRRELLLVWTTLVVAQVLTLAGAVGLLSRMTPAVSQIMADNEFSIEGVERMLTALASTPATPQTEAQFEQALDAIRDNVTEPEEPAQIERIEAAYHAALAGRDDARGEVTDALRTLSHINRRAMRRASDDASRVGHTGAWAAAMLGVLSMTSALALFRRLRMRVVRPIEDAARAVQAIGEGDQHRRCPTAGPTEVLTLATGVEALRERRRGPAAEPAPAIDPCAVVVALLDREPGLAFVVDDEGRVLHANLAGTRALLVDAELAEVVRTAAAEEPSGWGAAELLDGLRLVRRDGVDGSNAQGEAL